MESITILINHVRDYHKLYSIINRELSNKSFIIRLGSRFLEPFDVLVITQFVIFQKQRNCQIKISAELPAITAYLREINIVQFCNDNQNAPRTLDAIDSITAMPIRRVEKETMNEYINVTQQYFNGYCTGKDLDMLNLCLSELINNVYDHSHSPIGAYVFCQYYPKINEIRMAVSDLGVGIPFSVNSYNRNRGEKTVTAKETVKWALK